MPDSKIKKVLTVLPGKKESNSMVFVINEHNNLLKSGICSELFYLDFSRGIAGLFSQIKSLKKKIKFFKPDVIHAHYGSLNALVCSFVKRSPMVITFRGSDLNYSSKADGFLRNLIQILFSNLAALRADKIICVSNNLKKKLFFGKSKATVITTGVNKSIFKPIERRVAREKLGWNNDEKVILFVGGSTPNVKRLDVAEDVAKIVKKEILNSRIEVLYGNVSFDKMPYYYNASDCLLFTSDNEGSPCSVQESLACNLPIISVDVGDVAEQIKGVKNCYIVERDKNLIAKKIINTLNLSIRSDGQKKVEMINSDEKIKEIIFIYQNL